jgi:Big-like domain-containing protein/WD40 repeat protein
MVVAMILASSCSSDGVNDPPRSSTPEPPGVAFPGIVSNPVAVSVLRTTLAGAITDVEAVWVSLPSGRVPEIESAIIVNRRTGKSVAAVAFDGGFDPVPIGARVGDTLIVGMRTGSSSTHQSWAVVSGTKRPAVVRTEPSSKRRDVARSAHVLVVFSEPIDPASLTGATFTLSRNGERIIGDIASIPDRPWVARLTPRTPLAADASYELIVSEQVHDLSAETLESAVHVTFSTSAAMDASPRIAFSSWNGVAIGIYTMNPDGTGLTHLTDGNDPSFSPDGTRIAFWRYTGLFTPTRVPRVYVMNADGSDVTEVVSGGYQPTWSPDGQSLAYGCGGICVINVDRTGQRVITDPERPFYANDLCIRDTDPAWSPDGSTIAFTRWPDARIPVPNCLTLGLAISFPFDFWTEVWFVDANGSNLRALRDDGGNAVTYAGWPAWSPDGKHLAFYYAGVGEERVDVAGRDGVVLFTAVRQSPPYWENVLGSPDWSPDGTQILFSSRTLVGFADATGSGSVRTFTPPFSVLPYSLSWSWSRK